jgi:uncharacterized protein
MTNPEHLDPTVRSLSLDALRGIAVMGILVMNIIDFALPQAAYLNPVAFGGDGVTDRVSWAAAFLLIDNKMRGLFSMLFGASMMLIYERSQAKDGTGAAVHKRRMAWLFGFGLIHYFFIWDGDILTLYAACGMLGMVLLTLDERSLARVSLCFFLIGFLLLAAIAGGMQWTAHVAHLPGASASDVTAYQNLLREHGPTGVAKIAREMALMRSDYLTIIRDNFAHHAAGPVQAIMVFAPETLGLMALGMALLRNGFLQGYWAMKDYRRAAGIAYAVGFMGLVPLLWQCIASGYDTITVTTIGLAWSMPFRIAVMVGHAALAMMVVKRFETSHLIRRIAAAGRAAFSNYLATSIVMTLIFNGYGFGWFGYISRGEAYCVALCGAAVMLAWSKPWLDRFHFGPFEWLWRSLARGKIQAMRRS